MLDIGFWELLLIGLVALLVVGPERLPGLAHSTGIWVGRVHRQLARMRAELMQAVDTPSLHQTITPTDETRSDTSTTSSEADAQPTAKS